MAIAATGVDCASVRRACAWPSAASQRRSEPSAPPVNSDRPSGRNATGPTEPERDRSVARPDALARSQSRVVPSLLVDAIVLPSGANATASIASRCPSREWRSAPVARSHTFTVQSSEPVASVRPSAANATQVIALVCRARVVRSAALATSQMIAEASRLPEARRLTVGRERQAGDRTLVPFQHGPLAARGQVPEIDDLTVTAEGHGERRRG